MNPGFAGIDNELYYADNTLMLFGDAKQVIGDVVKVLTGRRGTLIFTSGRSGGRGDRVMLSIIGAFRDLAKSPGR